MPRFLYFLLALTAFLPLTVSASRGVSRDTVSARRAFVDLPLEKLEILSRESRLDMLDYFDNDSIFKAPNNLGGRSYIESLTSDFLSLSLTGSSRLQIKVLTFPNGRQVVMTVYTVGDPGGIRDSVVDFYDADLHPLKREKFFKMPDLSVFFNTDLKGVSKKNLEDVFPFYAVEIEANPDNSNLTGRLSYEEILTVEDKEAISGHLGPEVEFVWNSNKYKLKQ